MSNSNEIQILISSPPDREFLVSEIFVGSEQIAEINKEDESYEVEIYPRQSGECWKISYDELIDSLSTAKQKLKNRLG